RLAVDHHGYRTAEDEADLLVLVPVLGDLDIGIDVDEADREPFCVDNAAEHPVPDPRRLQFRDHLIHAHFIPPVLMTSSRPSPASGGGNIFTYPHAGTERIICCATPLSSPRR